MGSRIRRRRKALALTLREVAEGSELTPGFLSQLERDRATASVAALQRICGVLGLAVGDLFTADETSVHEVLRAADAGAHAFGDRASKTKLSPRSFDRLEVLLGHLEPGGSTGAEAHSHGDAEELLLVIEGRVIVEIGDRQHELGPLDSVHYRSSEPHRVSEATGIEGARVLWTMSPPSY